MKAHRFITSFVLCCVSLAAARDYSGVVVNKATKTPLEGVFVSVEHSEYYTLTDKDGKFFLNDPTPLNPDVTPIAKQLQSIKVTAQWNLRGRTLDLSSVPEAKSVSIYTTNGKKVFSSQIPYSKIVSLPSLGMGIYLVELRGEHGVIARKNATDSERLIFRHYDYLPKDSTMANSNTDMRIELKQDERSPAFDQSKIHEYRFTISQDSLNYLNTYGYNEEFVPANLKYGNEDIGKVGIRYKGSYSLHEQCFQNNQKRCEKISYKVKFTRYDENKRFYGLKKINLHALNNDNTKMHDMISYGLFRDMGIYAPRSAYANVYVNDRLIGLFLAVEEIDGRFTKSRWPDYGNGNLYKEVWPKSSDANYYREGLKTNDAPEDNASTQKMVSYYNKINSSNEQNFEQNLSSYMDFDYFLRYIAVDVAIKNWDGVRAFYVDKNDQNKTSNHNYYFYEEENSNGKIWLIPWDMDQAMTQRDSYFDGMGGGGFPGGGWGGQPLPQWNVATTDCGNKNVNGQNLVAPNCDKLFKLTAAVFWNRYVQLGDLFLKDIFVEQKLRDKIDKYQNLINNAVQQDPNINESSWRNEVNTFKGYLGSHATSFRNHLHP